jgi:DNA-directed RNA polymerase subunit RPC12/RpoP
MVEMTRKKRKRKLPDEGVIEKPDVPIRKEIQEVKKVKCPWCGSRRVFQNSGSKSGIVYYRCGRCVDGETGDWTTFKVWIAE